MKMTVKMEKEYNEEMLACWGRHLCGEKSAIRDAHRFNEQLAFQLKVSRNELAWTEEEIAARAALALTERTRE